MDLVDLVIDKTEKVPRYCQLKAGILNMISQGGLKPGDPLPSETALVNKCKISRNTVRQALQELVHEQVIYKVHGIGTFLKKRISTSGGEKPTLVSVVGYPDSDTAGDNYFSALFRGIRDGACQRKLQLSVSNIKITDVDSTWHRLKGPVGQGFLIIGTRKEHEKYVRKIGRLGPTLSLGTTFKDSSLSFVDSRNEQGAYRATEYLIRLGHTRIGIITYPFAYTDTIDRLKGYKKALADYGLLRRNRKFINLNRRFCQEFNGQPEHAKNMINAFWEDLPRPTAIFVAGHTLTEWTIRALENAGVAIPRDVSVIGMEDYCDKFLELEGITLLHQDSYTLGSTGLEILFKMLTGEVKEPVHHFLDLKFVERTSCRKHSPNAGRGNRGGK